MLKIVLKDTSGQIIIRARMREVHMTDNDRLVYVVDRVGVPAAVLGNEPERASCLGCCPLEK